MAIKLFCIDNGLFSYNLSDEFEKKGCESLVYNSETDMKIIDSSIKKFKPDMILISSGVGSPSDAGNSVSIIRTYVGKIPILGIGLGSQCIIEAFDGKVDRCQIAVHGKTVKVSHDGSGIFKDIDDPFIVGRYSSLGGIEIPYDLEVLARDENNMVMAVKHKSAFVIGLEFHPESILTPQGSVLIGNIIKEISKK